MQLKQQNSGEISMITKAVRKLNAILSKKIKEGIPNK